MRQLAHAFHHLKVVRGWVPLPHAHRAHQIAGRIWKHSDGWTAQEILTGSHNKLVGILIRDEQGNRMGVVKTIEELP